MLSILLFALSIVNTPVEGLGYIEMVFSSVYSYMPVQVLNIVTWLDDEGQGGLLIVH